MSLTAEQETLGFSLKVGRMEAASALKMERARKVRQDWRLDPQRVVIRAFVAGAALLGALGSVTTVVAFYLGKAAAH